jgi:hypothetical protein
MSKAALWPREPAPSYQIVQFETDPHVFTASVYREKSSADCDVCACPSDSAASNILPTVISEKVAAHQGLQQILSAQLIVSGPEVTADDILSTLVAAPGIERPNTYVSRESARDLMPRKVDFLKRDAANSELALLGEKFALKHEKARLIFAGKETLAEGVEHTSQELGDGMSYDIRSYEENGTDRFIEVKTTRFSRYTPFYVTPNE